jgi:hypothetical protein
LIAEADARLQVDGENADRHDAGWGFADEHRLIPFEVIAPNLRSRVEERVNRAVEIAREVRALVEVALGAGQAEVVGLIRAAVLSGDDVFDVKGEEGVVAVKAAVFAPVFGASPNQSPQSGRHDFDGESASNRRAFDFRIAMQVPNET